MKAVATQFCPVLKDIAANINTMEGMVAEAAHNGAELVVFPEMATTGYSFMSSADARPFSEGSLSTTSPSIKALSEASTGLGIAIVWGFVEKGPGEELYNAQAIALPGRGVVATYQKSNLFGNDHLWATEGKSSPPVVSWKGKRIGLLICRDIRDKSDSVPDLYEPGDADVVAFSANFGDGAFPASAWMSFVKDNEIPLIVSNRYGQEENNNFGEGGICIIKPPKSVNCVGVKWSAPCFVYDTV